MLFVKGSFAGCTDDPRGEEKGTQITDDPRGEEKGTQITEVPSFMIKISSNGFAVDAAP